MTRSLALVELRGELGHRQSRLSGLQARDDGFLVGFAAVLAQLELALEQFDLHLEAHDAADEAVDVTVWQLGEIVAGARAFKLGDELRQQAM